MKNILILSNNCISNSEPNGRTHGNYMKSYEKAGCIHNFFIRGNSDKKSVRYIFSSNKKNLISKLSFGLFKVDLKIFNGEEQEKCVNNVKSKKSNFVFFHMLRNFAYSNRNLIKKMCEYAKINNINVVEIWGSNVPFLYKFGYTISKKTNIPLVIFTGEDYPLKKYNYIGHKSLFFHLFQNNLNKKAKQAYSLSSLNVYSCNELKEAYKTSFATKNDHVLLFPSSIKKMNIIKKNDSKVSIFYGGNLYSGRCQSLIDIASFLKNDDCVINVFGNGNENDISNLIKYKNVNYHGVVSYEKLINEMKNADLLLHIEGFSKDYINDCKYAFSSKISDYYMTGKPVFMYGPYKISGIKFAYNLCKDMTALEKNELYKLKDFIYLKTNNSFSYKKIEELFDADKTSEYFEKLVESI